MREFEDGDSNMIRFNDTQVWILYLATNSSVVPRIIRWNKSRSTSTKRESSNRTTWTSRCSNWLPIRLCFVGEWSPFIHRERFLCWKVCGDRSTTCSAGNRPTSTSTSLTTSDAWLKVWKTLHTTIRYHWNRTSIPYLFVVNLVKHCYYIYNCTFVSWQGIKWQQLGAHLGAWNGLLEHREYL